MADSTTLVPSDGLLLPPILRIPGELLVEIFRQADMDTQVCLSSVCLALREVGLPEIFRYLTIGHQRRADDEPAEGWDQDRARRLANFNALVGSPHRFLVRSVSFSLNFDLLADVAADPLSQAIPNSLHLFPLLTAVQSILSLDVLRAGHAHPTLAGLELVSLDSEPDPWAVFFDGEPARQEKGLVVTPVQMLAFDWDGPDGARSSWTDWKGGSAMSLPIKRFIAQTTALKIYTPQVSIYGLANVPIPVDCALATTRIPLLSSLDLVGVDLPADDFLASVDQVVTSQRPQEYFALRLATAHPVTASLVALGQVPSFRQLEKVLDLDRLGHGQMTVEIRQARAEGQWDVTRLSLGIDGGAVVPRFLTSLGTELRHLSRLEISASSDPSSQLEIKWPKDWDTVVVAFRSLPCLTYLGLGSSLTPHETYTNDIACCDETFAQLANSVLHERALLSGGWWSAWKRLGGLLNLRRVRRLGPSLPEGCEIVWFAPVFEMWKGVVAVVRAPDGRQVKGIIGGQSSPDLRDGTEDDVRKKAFVDGECREMMQGWRCFACGGIGQEKDLFESIDACGEDEVDQALRGEWKAAWTEADLIDEQGR